MAKALCPTAQMPRDMCSYEHCHHCKWQQHDEAESLPCSCPLDEAQRLLVNFKPGACCVRNGPQHQIIGAG